MLWDCPGDNERFHQDGETYFTLCKLYCMDLIAVCYKDPFKGSVLDLVLEANRYNIPIVLVRTQVDVAVADVFNDHPEWEKTPRSVHTLLLENIRGSFTTQWETLKRARQGAEVADLKRPDHFLFSSRDFAVHSTGTWVGILLTRILPAKRVLRDCQRSVTLHTTSASSSWRE